MVEGIFFFLNFDFNDRLVYVDIYLTVYDCFCDFEVEVVIIVFLTYL